MDDHEVEIEFSKEPKLKLRFRHLIDYIEDYNRSQDSENKIKSGEWRNQGAAALENVLMKVKSKTTLETMPIKIKVKGTYKGPAFIVISCVEAECDNSEVQSEISKKSKKPKCRECNAKNYQNCLSKSNSHFHIVIGKGNENCSRGVMFCKKINIEEPDQEFELEIGIISTKMEDMKYVSQIRGYDEMNKEPKLYDLNRVKLRIDFSIENHCNVLVPHYSIFSQTVYNKGNGNYKDVLIKDIFSDNTSPYVGGKKFMITGSVPCNSRIRFVMPGDLEFIADPRTIEIHQNCGISFKSPKFPAPSNALVKGNVFVDKAYPDGRFDHSKPMDFFYDPQKQFNTPASNLQHNNIDESNNLMEVDSTLFMLPNPSTNEDILCSAMVQSNIKTTGPVMEATFTPPFNTSAQVMINPSYHDGPHELNNQMEVDSTLSMLSNPSTNEPSLESQSNIETSGTVIDGAHTMPSNTSTQVMTGTSLYDEGFLDDEWIWPVRSMLGLDYDYNNTGPGLTTPPTIDQNPTTDLGATNILENQSSEQVHLKSGISEHDLAAQGDEDDGGFFEI